MDMKKFLFAKPTDEVSLALDIEVVTDGKFPAPVKKYAGEIACITVLLSNEDVVRTYGTRQLSHDIMDVMADRGACYILCKDEAEMINRVIYLIEGAKPTYAIGDDTSPALAALYARAQELGLVRLDLNAMFKKYDSPYAAYCI